MPFIVAARPEDLDRGPGAAVAEAGKRLANLSATFYELKGRRDRERAEAVRANQRLELEEQRAKIMLAREQRLAGDAEAKAGQQEADRAGAMQGFDELEQKSMRQAGEQAFQMALGSPEGVLGPYGLLKAGVAGIYERQQAQQRMQGYQALAEKMSPGAAAAYLTKKQGEEKRKVFEDGFALEARYIQDALAGEKIDPEMASTLNQGLQVEMRSGRPPGATTKELAKNAALQAKLRARETAWAEVDNEAAELLTTARTLGKHAPGDVDPLTGRNMQAEMAEALANAEAEWAKTDDPTYRAGTDPKQALAALKKIVFGMKASSDPQGYVDERIGVQMQEGVMAKDARARGAERMQKAQGGAQGGSGGGSGGGSRVDPGRQPAKQKPAPRTDQQRLEGILTEGAQGALRAGTREERAARITELRNRVADELGLDVTDPKVHAAVREILTQVRGR